MFSFGDYKEILRLIQETGLQADYKEALKRDKFIIMRHDVEYSVERAYALSKVERSMDFTSTYFFQWTNNSYNILSRRNMDMIKDMHERGHQIGLHFALNGMTDMEQIRKQIVKEMHILSDMFGFEIDTFSVHRPSKDVLRENIKLPGDKTLERSWKYDKEAFIAAWKSAGGNISKLASMLDVSRVTLYRYLKKYGLGPKTE